MGTGRHSTPADAELLDALGPQGFLVNVARGSVIDEAALVQALRDKTRQAVADRVFDNLRSYFATGSALSAA